MLCPFCKTENPDDATTCTNCGEGLEQQTSYTPQRQNNQGCLGFLWESFINLLWFLFITGIIALAIVLFLQAHGYDIVD